MKSNLTASRTFFSGSAITAFCEGNLGTESIVIRLDSDEVRGFHDIELAVFELGRLWVNGENDLEYTLERLAIHKLTNHAK